MENQEFFFGVDVSKAMLDIAVMKEGEIVLERQLIARVYACITQRKLFQINYQNALA